MEGMNAIIQQIEHQTGRHIPRMTKADRQAYLKQRQQNERALVEQYQRQHAIQFMQQRSLYSEQGVLEHRFNDLDPESPAGFKELARRARDMANEFIAGEHYAVCLTGKPGSGKTLLASAMLNMIHQAQPLTKCLFVSAPLLAELAYAQYHDNEVKRRERYYQVMQDIQEADVMVLDDLGTESSMQSMSRQAANTVQKTLFQVGDTIQHKSLIVTTNHTPNQLKDIYNPKVISRIITANPRHVLSFMDVPDYRAKHL